MMYPYMTLYAETEIVHSQIMEENDVQKIIVYFERPTEDGFDLHPDQQRKSDSKERIDSEIFRNR